jgi:hypothetical protein
MDRPHVRFSRPVYESLPWIYLGVGLLAVLASYALQGIPILSFLAGLVGFTGVLGGVVILLRRRDYREMRQRYPDDV